MHLFYHTLFAALLWLPRECWAQVGGSRTAELYTQNAICKQNNCINPLFPGLNDLPQLEQIGWQTSTFQKVGAYLDFCQGVINYDPALPSPTGAQALLSTIVKSQDDAASTMFFYHLSGMGYEAWEHTRPGDGRDDCVKAVWKMVCFTYFPKTDAGSREGEVSSYQRPCSGACQSYLQKCQVECCDESPQCVFSHTLSLNNGTGLLQTGYVDHAGPSTYCTGSNGPRGARLPFALLLGLLGFHLALGNSGWEPDSASPEAKHKARQQKGHPGGWLLISALIACALFLQGCDADVPKHTTGNWRQKADYLVGFEFTEPGMPRSTAVLNSCNIPGLAPTLQCSGHGYCKEWSTRGISKAPVSFCVCNMGWGDPECRTPRKSQVIAFVLSLCGGFLGLDYFYLGFPIWGTVKMFTLGGAGLWWLLDIVRTGAGPIYAANFRVNQDLPHWVFVLVSIALFMVIGFVVALHSYMGQQRQKRDMLLRLKDAEEARRLRDPANFAGPRFMLPEGPGAPRDFQRGPDFHGYGAALPYTVPSAGAPYAHGGAYY